MKNIAATASARTPTQTQRGHRFTDANELRSAVHQKCLVEFRERFGREWTEDDRLVVLPPDGGGDWAGDVAFREEQEAQRVFVNLRKAMVEAVEFVKRCDPTIPRVGLGNPTVSFLRWWVPMFVEPLLKHAALAVEPRLSDVRTGRAALAHDLDRLDLLGVGRVLETRELAIVSLLVGNWPCEAMPREGLTVASVLEREANCVRHHLKQHGQAGRRHRNPTK